MAETQKFLDSNGIQHLWSKISMQDYPNNETLMTVINAIDETKLDKEAATGNTTSGSLVKNIALNANGKLVVESSFPQCGDIANLYNYVGNAGCVIIGGENDYGVTYPALCIFGTQSYGHFQIRIYDAAGICYKGECYRDWDLYLKPVGTQSDWNDSNEESISFIQNRTHYSTNVQQEIFPSQTVTIENGQATSIDFGWSDDGWESVYNNLAIIVFDGVEYTTTYTKDSDEVTYLTWTVNDVDITIIDGVSITTDISLDGEHTIEAFYLKEEIHQLESKYIPDTIARVDDVKPITLRLFDTWYQLSDNDKIPYIEGYNFNTYYEALSNYPQVYIISGFEELDIDTGGLIGGNDPWLVTLLTENSIYLERQISGYSVQIQLQSDSDYLFIFIEEAPAWKSYTDTSIANLVDSAPETLNTLNKLATALLQENQDLTTTLNQVIEEKATLEDLDNHVNDTEVHITAAERELWNVHTSGFDKIVANGGTVYQGIDHNTTLNLDNDDWFVKTIEDPEQLGGVKILSLSINYDKVYNEIIARLPNAEGASF